MTKLPRRRWKTGKKLDIFKLKILTAKAPYKDRVEFWKFQHAWVTFAEVTNLCDQIIKQKIDSGHPLLPSMMTTLHIFYGRPFKQRPEVRISETIVPADYKDIHDWLINMRDQTYAHMDVDGPKTANQSFINKVGVFVRGGQAKFALTMVHPRGIQIEKIRELTVSLSEKTWYHAEKIWRKHFKAQPVLDGDYEINLSKECDDFLKPISF
jgi:hypothetical protein